MHRLEPPSQVCGPLPSNQTSYNHQQVSCAPGEIMVGIHGQTGAPYDYTVVEQLGPRCQSTTGGTITDLAAVGGGDNPSQPFSLTCPTGKAVTAVVGGVGEVVDSIALVCADHASVHDRVGEPVDSRAGTRASWCLRGTNLPAPSGATAVVTNGDNTSNGFVFGCRRRQRPPTGCGCRPVSHQGPATIQLSNGAAVTNAFPITVSATPGVPVITNILDGAGLDSPRSGLPRGLRSTSKPTAVIRMALGSVVRFQQGASRCRRRPPAPAISSRQYRPGGGGRRSGRAGIGTRFGQYSAGRERVQCAGDPRRCPNSIVDQIAGRRMRCRPAIAATPRVARDADVTAGR